MEHNASVSVFLFVICQKGLEMCVNNTTECGIQLTHLLYKTERDRRRMKETERTGIKRNP